MIQTLEASALTADEAAEVALTLAEQRTAAVADEAKRKAYAAAFKRCHQFGARLERDYRQAAATLQRLVAESMACEAMRNAVNADLPQGAEPIGCPESDVRDVPGVPARTLRTRTEWGWAPEGQVQPLAADAKVRVARDGRGVWDAPGQGLVIVHRRKFRVTEVQEYGPGETGPRLLQQVVPALCAGESAYWKGVPSYEGDNGLLMQALLKAPRRRPAPTPGFVRETWTLIPDDANRPASSGS